MVPNLKVQNKPRWVNMPLKSIHSMTTMKTENRKIRSFYKQYFKYIFYMMKTLDVKIRFAILKLKSLDLNECFYCKYKFVIKIIPKSRHIQVLISKCIMHLETSNILSKPNVSNRLMVSIKK